MEDKDFTNTERRVEDKYLTAVNIKFAQLREDVVEIKGTMKDVAQALTKLALVEERQAQSSAAMNRAFDNIAKVDHRVDIVVNRVVNLEKADQNHGRVANWVDRVVFGLLGVVGVLILTKLGLFG